MEKVSKVVNVLFRLRFVIGGVVLAGITTALVVTALNGQAKTVQLDETEIPYGTSVKAIGSSLFGNAEVQYSNYNENNWSNIVPTKAGKYKARAVSKNGYGVTTYSAAKTFTIAPKPLTISIDTTTLEYGNTVTYSTSLNSGDKVENIEFKLGDNFNTTDPFNGEETFKTTANLNFSSLKIKNADDEDITFCYDISCPEKEISVKKRKLNLYCERYVKEYDGTALTNDGNFYISEETPLANGDEFSLGESTSIVEVGSVDIKQKAVIKNGELDRTAFYDIKWATPRLTITKRPITISTNSITKTYDAVPLSKDAPNSGDKLECQLTGSGLVEGHTFKYTFDSEGAYKAISNSPNSVTYQILDADNNDVTTKYYDVTTNFGRVNINKKDITLDYRNINQHYDGENHEGELLYDESDLAGEDVLEATLKSTSGPDSRTDIGFNTYSYDVVIKSGAGEDVSSCYRYNYLSTSGSISITKIPVTVTSNSLSKIYDGVNYSSDMVTPANSRLTASLTDGYLLDDHHLVIDGFDHEGEMFVGSNNSFSCHIEDGEGNNVNEYYTLTKVDGQISTSVRDINITINGGEWVYDGESHSVNNFTITQGELGEGDVLELNNIPTITNAGSVINSAVPVITHNGSEEVNEYYNINVEERGDLVVHKKQVTINASLPNSKIYDGVAYDIDTSSIITSVEGLPSQFAISFQFNKSHILKPSDGGEISIDNIVIENKNTLDVVTENFEFVFDGDVYDFDDTIPLGSVEIYKRTLDLSTGTVTKVYDGEEVNSFNATLDGTGYIMADATQLVNDDTIYVGGHTAVVNATNGDIENKIWDITITSATNGDVTGCYDFDTNMVFGTFNIEKADLTVEFTSISDTVYNSYSQCISDERNVTGLASKDVLDIVPTPLTNAGTYNLEQTFTYSIKDATTLEDVSNNYNDVLFIGPSFTIQKYQLSINMLDINMNLIQAENIDPDNYAEAYMPGEDVKDLTFVGTKAEIAEKLRNEIYPTISISITNIYDGTDRGSNYEVTVTYGVVKVEISDVSISLYPNYVVTYLDQTIDLESHTSWITSYLPVDYYSAGVEIACDEEIKEVGDYDLYITNKENIKIMHHKYVDGAYVEEDVSELFNIIIVDNHAVMSVEKYKYYFDIQEWNFEYDGCFHNITSYSGFLGDHHIELVGFDDCRDAGVYTYQIDDVSQIRFKDSTGNDVTYLYDIVFDSPKTFTTTITKRKIRIETNDYQKQFNMNPIDNSNLGLDFYVGQYEDHYHHYGYNPGNNYGVAYNNFISFEFPIKTEIHVHEEENDVIYHIKDSNGNDVSQNYDVEIIKGTLKIVPYEIYYTTSNTSDTYDGNPIDIKDDLSRSGSGVRHFVKLYANGGNLSAIINALDSNGYYALLSGGAESYAPGTYYLVPIIVMMLNGYDLVANGDIVFTSTPSVRVKINKKYMKIYNEEIHTFSDEFEPYAEEKLFRNGIVSGDTLWIGDEKWEANKIDYAIIPNMVNWSSVDVVFGPEYFSTYVNNSTVRITREINGYDCDVTNCYNIDYDWKTVTMEGQ